MITSNSASDPTASNFLKYTQICTHTVLLQILCSLQLFCRLTIRNHLLLRAQPMKVSICAVVIFQYLHLGPSSSVGERPGRCGKNGWKLQAKIRSSVWCYRKVQWILSVGVCVLLTEILWVNFFTPTKILKL